jgi:O-antigen ligase
MSSGRRRRRRSSRVVEDHVDEGPEGGMVLPEVDEAQDRGGILARLLGLVPVLFCLVGFGRHPGLFGTAALLLAGIIFFNPPSARLPYSLLCVAALAVLLPALSILPVSVPFVPEWREVLVRDFGVLSVPTLSVQPWVTLEAWCSWVVLVLWFLWNVGHWQDSTDRSMVTRWIALGLSLLAVLCLCFRAIGWEPDSWMVEGISVIGPFPNRNHLATLMVIGSVLGLASAYDLQRRRKSSWAIYAAGVVPCFAVILVAGSRAGLVLFFVGLLLWFLAAALRKRSMQRLGIMAAVGLSLTAGTVVFGGKLLSRFSSGGGSVFDVMGQDGRLQLFTETLDFVAQYPIAGIGMGNFEALFGMLHKLQNADVHFLHPESDWLWFMVEAGWPATLALLVGVFLFVKWLGPWRSGTKSSQRRERRLRMACGIAAGLAVVHGIVDVPLHNSAVATLVVLLGAMALYHGKLRAAPGIAVPWFFRLAGLFVAAVGCMWWATALGRTNKFGESAAEQLIERARDFHNRGDAASAFVLMDRAVEAAPYHYEAYWYRAAVGLKTGLSSSTVAEDFARARYLEPHTAQMCMDEADLWLKYDPLLAVPAWRDALKRDAVERNSRFLQMCAASRTRPELWPAVCDLATDAKLLLTVIGQSNREIYPALHEQFLARYPTLEGLTSYDRYVFFHHWATLGDRSSLVRALRDNLDWQADGWTLLAHDVAAEGHYEEAFQLAAKYVTGTVEFVGDSNQSFDTVRREFMFNPTDMKLGMDLAVLQRDRKLYGDAIDTLLKLAGLPEAPNYLQWELAKLYALKNDYSLAWEWAKKFRRL